MPALGAGGREFESLIRDQFYMSEHRDKLGQELNISDCVVWPNQNKLEIGLIVKLNPKMIKVKRIEPPKRWQPSTWNKYPEDIVKIDGPLVSMYIIKHSGAK